MPPDLKRKRSRPSDWWAVASTAKATEAPPQQDISPPKKRGHSAERGIQEASTAGNRGKRRTTVNEEDRENPEEGRDGEEDGEAAKPLRRGRSSNTEAELVAAAELADEVESANKKKRGRSAAVNAEDELVNEPTESPSVLQQGIPAARERHRPADRNAKNSKKVGRPTGAHVGKAHQKQLSTVGQVNGKKGRGRHSKGNGAKFVDERPPVEDNETAKPTRRGRSSNTQTELQAAVGMSAKELSTQRKLEQAANTEAQPVESMRIKRRAGQSDAKISEPSVPEPVSKDDAGRTARGRKSGTVIRVETVTSSLARDRTTSKKSGNRPKTSNVKPKKDSSAGQESFKSRGQIKVSRDLAMAEGTRKRNDTKVVNEEPPEPKRRRVEKESEQEPAPQAEKQPTYQHLAAVIRRISRQTIEAKWGPLPPNCIELISQLLQDLQRPVFVRHNDETKRKEAIKVMHVVSHRLISKISKGLPFPPATCNHREDDFNFEKILDYNRALEALLTPALHANELLESELVKAKVLLESEEDALAQLETNAKTEASIRKDAGRKLHPLLLSNDRKVENNDMNGYMGLGDNHSILPFTYTEDKDLQDIEKDLNDHLVTIQGNINKVEGISQAMTKIKAAVQATLFENLEIDQCEDVILG